MVRSFPVFVSVGIGLPDCSPALLNLVWDGEKVSFIWRFIWREYFLERICPVSYLSFFLLFFFFFFFYRISVCFNIPTIP